MKDRFPLSASELVLVPGMPSLLIIFIPRHVFRIVSQADFAQLVVLHVLRQLIEGAVLNVILKPEEQVTVRKLYTLPDDSLFTIGIFILGLVDVLLLLFQRRKHALVNPIPEHSNFGVL